MNLCSAGGQALFVLFWDDERVVRTYGEDGAYEWLLRSAEFFAHVL